MLVNLLQLLHTQKRSCPPFALTFWHSISIPCCQYHEVFGRRAITSSMKSSSSNLRIVGARVGSSSSSASTTKVGVGMARFVATESRTWVAGTCDSAASVKEVCFAGSPRFGHMVDVCSWIRRIEDLRV